MLIDILEWHRVTDGKHKRTSSLQELDAAIERANLWSEPELLSTPNASAELLEKQKINIKIRVEVLRDVDRALNDWMSAQWKKRPDVGWHGSVRNASGAVEQLVSELWRLQSKYDPGGPTNVEAYETARNNSIPALFEGCKCISRASAGDLVKDGKSTSAVVGSASSFVENLRKAAKLTIPPERPSTPIVPRAEQSRVLAEQSQVQHKVADFIKEAFGNLDYARWDIGEKFLQEVLNEAKRALIQEMASAVPFAGLAPTVAVLGIAIDDMRVAKLGARAVDRLNQRTVISDSKSALQTICQWQKEDRELQKTRVARASLNLGSQILGIASGGTAAVVQVPLGIRNAIDALADVIIEIGRQYQASRALTRYLNGQDGAHPLGREIFSASPLAAAYYILNTPTSFIALQFINLGAPGWRSEVEALIKGGNLAVARQEAARLIEESRYRIIPPEGGKYAETVKESMALKAKKFFSKK